MLLREIKINDPVLLVGWLCLLPATLSPLDVIFLAGQQAQQHLHSLGDARRCGVGVWGPAAGVGSPPVPGEAAHLVGLSAVKLLETELGNAAIGVLFLPHRLAISKYIFFWVLK